MKILTAQYIIISGIVLTLIAGVLLDKFISVQIPEYKIVGITYNTENANNSSASMRRSLIKFFKADSEKIQAREVSLNNARKDSNQVPKNVYKQNSLENQDISALLSRIASLEEQLNSMKEANNNKSQKLDILEVSDNLYSN